MNSFNGHQANSHSRTKRTDTSKYLINVDMYMQLWQHFSRKLIKSNDGTVNASFIPNDFVLRVLLAIQCLSVHFSMLCYQVIYVIGREMEWNLMVDC